MATILERGRYGNSGNFKTIGTYEDQKKAMDAMRALLALERYEVFYMRSWEDDDGWTIIDYGSHSDFFRYKEEK
jgi:hypothetical protein